MDIMFFHIINKVTSDSIERIFDMSSSPKDLWLLVVQKKHFHLQTEGKEMELWLCRKKKDLKEISSFSWNWKLNESDW